MNERLSVFHQCSLGLSHLAPSVLRGLGEDHPVASCLPSKLKKSSRRSPVLLAEETEPSQPNLGCVQATSRSILIPTSDVRDAEHLILLGYQSWFCGRLASNMRIRTKDCPSPNSPSASALAIGVFRRPIIGFFSMWDILFSVG
jgi:hypothetical protein